MHTYRLAVIDFDGRTKSDFLHNLNRMEDEDHPPKPPRVYRVRTHLNKPLPDPEEEEKKRYTFAQVRRFPNKIYEIAYHFFLIPPDAGKELREINQEFADLYFFVVPCTRPKTFEEARKIISLYHDEQPGLHAMLANKLHKTRLTEAMLHAKLKLPEDSVILRCDLSTVTGVREIFEGLFEDEVLEVAEKHDDFDF